jgi:Tfp pilus assembly protein PilF
MTKIMRLPRAVTNGCGYLALLCLAANLQAQSEDEIAGFEAVIKAGRFSEVVTALENYTFAHPQSWQALYQLAYVDFRLHRIQQSVAAVCKSLVLNPQFAESHKVLAYDLNILGRQDLAVQELQQALSYDPASSESHYELGRIFYERGSYLQAVEQLEKARQLTPSSVRTYHNLGLAYSAIGNDAKAIENFEESIRQSVPSAWPLIDYATYFNLRNKFERARDMLLQAIQIDSRWDQAFDELSKAYRGLGQTGEAISAMTRAIGLNTRKPEYHYVLARLYRQTHQLAEAKKQLIEYEDCRNAELGTSRMLPRNKPDAIEEP